MTNQTIIDNAQARLDKLEEDRQVAADAYERSQNLYYLNSQFGENDAQHKAYLVYNVDDAAEKLGITGHHPVSSVLHEFSKRFEGTKWKNISGADIKLLGELIEARLNYLIRYDAKSFSFYYADRFSPSEKYQEKLKAYNALSWWKRFTSHVPYLKYPKYISPDKLVKE